MASDAEPPVATHATTVACGRMLGESWLTQQRRHLCQPSLIALCQHVTQLCHSEGLLRCITADAWQVVFATTKQSTVASDDATAVASDATAVARPLTEGILRCITAHSSQIKLATTKTKSVAFANGEPVADAATPVAFVVTTTAAFVSNADGDAVTPNVTTVSFTNGHLRTITSLHAEQQL